jgi:hypothetical protein
MYKNISMEFKIDQQDEHMLEGYIWKINKDSKIGHKESFCVIGRKTVNGKRVHVRLHRLLMNCPRNLVVDHINGDSLDNRRENLRICTSKENSQNRKMDSKRNKSGYKGVSFNKQQSIWRAFVANKLIGCFETAEQAAMAYDIAAIKKFGQFAKTNF